jgi:hypothetical protein
VVNFVNEDAGPPVIQFATPVMSLVDLNPPAGGLDNVTDVVIGARPSHHYSPKPRRSDQSVKHTPLMGMSCAIRRSAPAGLWMQNEIRRVQAVNIDIREVQLPTVAETESVSRRRGNQCV